MDRFVKTDTDNVGAEALAAYGANPPKRFKTLRFEGGVPEAGATVTKDGADVGTVTSPADSPRVGPMGLAIVDAAVAEDGTKVEVAGVVATVAPLSALDPEKKKPRA
jgi:glycine cleavage system aminomethyltransferase T